MSLMLPFGPDADVWRLDPRKDEFALIRRAIFRHRPQLLSDQTGVPTHHILADMIEKGELTDFDMQYAIDNVATNPLAPHCVIVAIAHAMTRDDTYSWLDEATVHSAKNQWIAEFAAQYDPSLRARRITKLWHTTDVANVILRCDPAIITQCIKLYEKRLPPSEEYTSVLSQVASRAFRYEVIQHAIDVCGPRITIDPVMVCANSLAYNINVCEMTCKLCAHYPQKRHMIMNKITYAYESGYAQYCPEDGLTREHAIMVFMEDFNAAAEKYDQECATLREHQRMTHRAPQTARIKVIRPVQEMEM